MQRAPKAMIPSIFADFAGESAANWKLIIGQEVKHRKYGQGTITRIDRDTNNVVCIVISFPADPEGNGSRQFHTKDFASRDSIWRLTLPSNLAIIERSREHWGIKRELVYSPTLRRMPREARCWACHAELVEYSRDVTPEGHRNCDACGWITCDCGACRSPQSELGGCDRQVTRLGSERYDNRVRERLGATLLLKKIGTDDDEGWGASLARATPPDP